MYAKAVKDSNGESLGVVCIGGEIMRLPLTAGVWTEFVPPAGGDAYNIEFAAKLPDGVAVMRTSTATFPDLVDGAPVTSAHLERSMSVFDVQVPLGMDRDWGVKFLFTSVGGDTVLKLESLAA